MKCHLVNTVMERIILKASNKQFPMGWEIETKKNRLEEETKWKRIQNAYQLWVCASPFLTTGLGIASCPISSWSSTTSAWDACWAMERFIDGILDTLVPLLSLLEHGDRSTKELILIGLLLYDWLWLDIPGEWLEECIATILEHFWSISVFFGRVP